MTAIEPAAPALQSGALPRPPGNARARGKVGEPKYRQLRDTLAELIGQLPAGASTPTERELCQRYGMSRATVRHALHQLEAEQRVYRRQGKGTFVARPKIEQPLELTSHTEDMRARGAVPGSKLLDVSRVAAGAEVGAMLGLEADEEVLRIERLRLADGDPIAIEMLSVNAQRFDGISAALGESQSFYQLLHVTYGIELASAEETIEAVVAGPREAELLGSRPGEPLLLLSRRTLDIGGNPIEYVRALYRGDRFRFRTHLERHRGLLSEHPAVAVGLRTAARGDASALAEVFVAAWQHAYPGVVEPDVIAGLDPAEIADWMASLIAAPRAATVVAQDRLGKVVGFTRYGDDPEDSRRGQIYALYVHPESGGRGVGRTLLTHALDGLSAGLPRPVTLWVFEANQRARRLYASFGFAADGAHRVEPQYRAEEIRLVRPSATASVHDESQGRSWVSHLGTPAGVHPTTGETARRR